MVKKPVTESAVSWRAIITETNISRHLLQVPHFDFAEISIQM